MSHQVRTKYIEEEEIVEKKLKIELILAIVTVIVVGCIGAGLYFFYKPTASTAPAVINNTTKSVGGTTVKSTSEKDVYVVSPSKNDSIQVKTSTGALVTVPINETPTK